MKADKRLIEKFLLGEDVLEDFPDVVEYSVGLFNAELDKRDEVPVRSYLVPMCGKKKGFPEKGSLERLCSAPCTGNLLSALSRKEIYFTNGRHRTSFFLYVAVARASGKRKAEEVLDDFFSKMDIPLPEPAREKIRGVLEEVGENLHLPPCCSTFYDDITYHVGNEVFHLCPYYDFRLDKSVLGCPGFPSAEIKFIDQE